MRWWIGGLLYWLSHPLIGLWTCLRLGMTCGGCAMTITKNLKKEDWISDISISSITGRSLNHHTDSHCLTHTLSLTQARLK